jgi:hypothetical protein
MILSDYDLGITVFNALLIMVFALVYGFCWFCFTFLTGLDFDPTFSIGFFCAGLLLLGFVWIARMILPDEFGGDHS